MERHAAADLRVLDALEVIPPGSEALKSVFRLLGREFDLANTEGDRYGKINTAREMLRVRDALAPTKIEIGGYTIEDILAELPE